MAIRDLTLEKGCRNWWRRRNGKREQKMTKEKKEFLKGEFSGFKCVLECFETQFVFSPWIVSLFIATRVDLGLRTRAQRTLLAQHGCLYSCLAHVARLVRVSVFTLNAHLPRLTPVLVFALSASWAGPFFSFLLFSSSFSLLVPPFQMCKP